jgi:uncharacterized membrane protein
VEVAVLTFVCAILYALFIIGAAMGGSNTDKWLASVLYNGIGTVVPLVVYLAAGSRGTTTWRGVGWSSLAGLGVMLFSVVLARVYQQGGTVSFVVPVVYGGAILLSAVFGWLVLGEKPPVGTIVGLGLILLGIACIVRTQVRDG